MASRRNPAPRVSHPTRSGPRVGSARRPGTGGPAGVSNHLRRRPLASHHRRPDFCLFLAGGITDCPDWQKTATAALEDLDVTVFNPRRSSFPKHDLNAEAAQVGWEYQHLRRADLMMFWFPESPTSHQPIALYELGMAAGQDADLVVGADAGYVRRTNMVAQLSHAREGLHVHSTLADTIEACRTAIRASR
ncbi:nucleoside 2-deoxyribosyltransferase domain-containing protein [Streptomyces sp. 110]|uniref:Nucleoside 2-deoxyribosyltransferase domain-containing protein n=1 Tax=Streptomyces endocoffeicus TaxID=2898945 RepID=A0ABS1PS99_9ACTN|nr:nucleoside 2-deoxyribosyltransferase domain-containing protein [Streptomyces endocoffeicus]